MSDTPRTDAQGYGDGRHPYVSTEFARALERELAREKLRAENNGKLAHNLSIELAAERELADRLAEALLDIEGRASDESVALHPDADAKAFVDDCWEWSEQALAAYKAARNETRH